MGCERQEIRNEVSECSHLISHFPDGFLIQKIEFGPEKWEVGFKWGFSRLKVSPLAMRTNVRRRSQNKSHLRGATQTEKKRGRLFFKVTEAIPIQLNWSRPSPGCPDVPFSRHSRFHPLLPCHILIYLNSPSPFLLSFPPFIAHGTIYSPEITGLPTAGQSIAIQPSRTQWFGIDILSVPSRYSSFTLTLLEDT